MSSTVRPHSLVDNIHACISYARTQRARNGKICCKEVTALSLAHSICDVQLLGKNSCANAADWYPVLETLSSALKISLEDLLKYQSQMRCGDRNLITLQEMFVLYSKGLIRGSDGTSAAWSQFLPSTLHSKSGKHGCFQLVRKYRLPERNSMRISNKCATKPSSCS